MPSDKALHRKQVLDAAEYVFVRGPEDHARLKRMIQTLQKEPMLGVDTETTGLNFMVHQVRLIQIASEEQALIVDLNGWEHDWEYPELQLVKGLLESPTPKVLQNAAFDLNFLLKEGVNLGGPIFDTMIASAIINNGTGAKNDLGSIVRRRLKYELPKELQKANWGGEITEEMLCYAARDAICLPHLSWELKATLEQTRTKENVTLYDIFKLEMRVLKPVALMQFHGFAFDLSGALELRDALALKAEGLKVEFLEHLDQCIRLKHPERDDLFLPRDPEGAINTRTRESGSLRLGTKVYAGFNPSSGQQMAVAFTNAGIILPPNAEGKTSLDKNLLAFIRAQYSIVDQYLTWKSASNQVSNIEQLIEAVGPDGRIHAGYRQMGTKTGRMSCSGPNLQQVDSSPEFRSKFIAAPGYVLVVADFSQIELRVAAELSGEERMLEAYRAGRDLHTETAALMAGVPLEAVTKEQRQSAKVCNFGLLYGAGPATLRKQSVAQYGIDIDIEEARRLVEGFRAAYPTLYKWQQREGSRTSEAVQTISGRRRVLVGFDDKYTTRINSQVQGTAGDIAKIAIWQVWHDLCSAYTDEARLIAMVHDEIVLEVWDHAADFWAACLKQCMEAAGNAVCSQVPIVAEVAVGRAWSDCK